jgi:hypothetical protein
MSGHPRLEVDDTGHVYVAAADVSGRLWMAQFVSPGWTAPVLVATGLTVNGAVTLASGLTLREANGFSFAAAGGEPFQAPQELRFVYTTLVGSKAVLKGVRCQQSPGWTCATDPAWTTPVTTNSFFPAVASLGITPGIHQWQVSYQQEGATAGQIALFHSKLTPASFTTARVTGFQTPCPDARYNVTNDANGGYWGDYDAVDPRVFRRTFADSSGSTCTRQGWISSPLLVSEVALPLL